MKKLLVIFALMALPVSLTFADGYGMTSAPKQAATSVETEPMPAAQTKTTTRARGVSFGNAVLGRDCFSWASCRQLQRQLELGVSTTTATPVITNTRMTRRATTATNPRLRYHLSTFK